MGDHIEIKAIGMTSKDTFAIDLFNETKNSGDRIFVKKDELYKMLEEAEKKFNEREG